jgi:hypothetical protein
MTPYEELHQSHIRVHHEMVERFMHDLHAAQLHEQMRQQMERDQDLLQQELERLREAQAMAMLGLAQWQMQATATGPLSSLQAFDEFHDAFIKRGEEFHRQFRERAKIAREKSRVEYSTWQQRLIESRDAAILFPGSISGGGGPVEGRGRFAFGQADHPGGDGARGPAPMRLLFEQGPPDEAWREFRTWFRDETVAFRASFHHATRPTEFTYMKPSRRGGLRHLDYV